MNLVLPNVTDIVLVTDERRATVYIQQGQFLPTATVVFDSAIAARQYIRSFGIAPPIFGKWDGHFTERDLTTNTDKRMRL